VVTFIPDCFPASLPKATPGCLVLEEEPCFLVLVGVVAWKGHRPFAAAVLGVTDTMMIGLLYKCL